MAYKFVFFVCLQALFLQNAYSQSINQPASGGQSQVTVTETCAQNPQLLVNQPSIIAQPGCQYQPTVSQCQPIVSQPSFIAQPNCQPIVSQPGYQCQSVVAQPSIVAPSCQPVVPQPVATVPNSVANPCDVDFVAQYALPTATIIQDDSIANNLAKALQILIVSNLLSNTLPFNDYVNLGVAQPALLSQPALQLAQPALLPQPALLQQPVLQLASPALQFTQVAQPFNIGGCGCGGLNYIF